MLSRKKSMNPGKGFANKGTGFKSRGQGLKPGKGFKPKPISASNLLGQSAEWGEDGSNLYGSTFKSRAVSRRSDPERVRSTPKPSDATKFREAQAVVTGLTVKSLRKDIARRSPAVMDMARGRMCLLLAPYAEHHAPDTTVGCHGNWSDMGKGGARKADDCYVVWGCFECHCWLDGSRASAGEKRQVFLLAMVRQMLIWEQIAVSSTEPERFVKAARWALQCLEDDAFDPCEKLQELML